MYVESPAKRRRKALVKTPDLPSELQDEQTKWKAAVDIVRKSVEEAEVVVEVEDITVEESFFAGEAVCTGSIF